jgi:hypothetical protein
MIARSGPLVSSQRRWSAGQFHGMRAKVDGMWTVGDELVSPRGIVQKPRRVELAPSRAGTSGKPDAWSSFSSDRARER